MLYSQKYPVVITDSGDSIVTGFGKENQEWSQLFSDLEVVLAPGGHTHSESDIIDFSTANYVPIGGIILWDGYLANIPSGYALCDGTNGTPDLRNKFIVGAGLTLGAATTFAFADNYATSGTGYYAIGATGGKDRHVLSIAELARHYHTVNGAYISGHDGNNPQQTTQMSNNQTSSAGSDYAHENRPTYYALAFIKRIA
jgi:microcystin-dependent protein